MANINFMRIGQLCSNFSRPPIHSNAILHHTGLHVTKYVHPDDRSLKGNSEHIDNTKIMLTLQLGSVKPITYTCFTQLFLRVSNIFQVEIERALL